MNLTGNRVLSKSVDEVRDLIYDNDKLKKILPGCSELVAEGPDELLVKITAGIGPIKASFNIVVERSARANDNPITLVGKGDAGALGSAKGNVQVTLAPVEGGTEINYDADIQLDGKLAQLGSRMVDQAAKKYLELFFKNLAADSIPEEDKASPVVRMAPPRTTDSGPDANASGHTGSSGKWLDEQTVARLLLDGFSWRLILGSAFGSCLGVIIGFLLMR